MEIVSGTSVLSSYYTSNYNVKKPKSLNPNHWEYLSKLHLKKKWYILYRWVVYFELNLGLIFHLLPGYLVHTTYHLQENHNIVFGFDNINACFDLLDNFSEIFFLYKWSVLFLYVFIFDIYLWNILESLFKGNKIPFQ